MGILNVTPDSFSDGGKYNQSAVAAVGRINLMERQGAGIIDIGGQSTRPNAEVIKSGEESARVLPVIQAARQMGVTTPISIDTFRADVARDAVLAGANIINDVSGGLLDSLMLRVASDLQVPICLMHYRGDPATMQGLANYGGDVVEMVAAELRERCAAALKAGVYRWNIIVDPGIGFAKTPQQSYQLTKETGKFAALCCPVLGGEGTSRVQGMPAGGFAVLVGPSRKSFIGHILKDEGSSTERRLWGTAAAATAAVQQGAHIVRVHDVAEMRDVIAVADAIYR
eukprot:CAMPEP_0184329252 /NCGR_PEP_ID=MMETSP1049-20130417/144050_1 /TAXON_ID=77928 /ORGANISM="Proteomonas sulcata, Strain CCMP704" /LENGTH=283 /DNA_ID=CAMNT_0026651605 /DNA_START=1021 /DNA_END=1872 /DNA_ORIENTATION=-